ncbi:hypothetical protein LBMAG42_08980 [Deltaproteobacteria bacterium]|nr:hypothetical protein LBMAG42_08980 [Deltaproteobacteria bacterium]
MNGRLIAAIVAFLVLVPVTAGLLITEQVVGKTGTEEAAAGPTDMLSGLQYVRIQRKDNLTKLGFDEGEAAGILTRMEGYEKKWNIGDPVRDTVALLLDQTDDLALLENSLCGRVSPARYTALQLLVEDQNGELRVRDLDALPRFESMGWYDTDRPMRVASAIDQIENREPDATKMGLAAVFARQIPMVLDRQSPWGPTMFNNWSWAAVKKKWPGVQAKLEAYVATMHLVLENVTGDGGLCRTQ